MKMAFISRILGAILVAASLLPMESWAQLASLKTVPVPEPVNLFTYVRDRDAAIRLGKALFWDMQVGSDGVQSCATCHFHAGADSRTKNQLNPASNGRDAAFGNNLLGLPPPTSDFAPNGALTAAHFPLHKLVNADRIADPADPRTLGNLISDTNDVVSSQGVRLMQFVDIQLGNPVDLGDPIQEDIPGFQGLRRVEPRNTPSVINAVFNFTNFWDGRANNIFNGHNPFGPADPTPRVYANLMVNGVPTLTPQLLRLRMSSLASQAVGPPLSDFEMSWRGRSWPKVGKKMLSLKPLAQQKVHPQDSVLGPLAHPATGLKTTYVTMIRQAFLGRLWNNTTDHFEFVDPLNPANGLKIVAGAADPLNTNQFTQMEANFSLFFGLAVQLYEATLLANDSKFDRFMEGTAGLTPTETAGLNAFNGNCLMCHSGAETTDASVALTQGISPVTGAPQPWNRNPLNASEFMAFLNGVGFYDAGFHNSGVRPGGSGEDAPSNPDNPNAPRPFEFLAENEDIGRGGNSPFIVTAGSDSFAMPLAFGQLSLWKANPSLVNSKVPMPQDLKPWVPPLPVGITASDTSPFRGRASNFGAFKTPGLRNVELTGPYMHNGGLSTLRQVVDFYARGGDFRETNLNDFDPAVQPIGTLIGSETRKSELVAFMLTLTDERVKKESAPFDHPELFVPVDGLAPSSPTGTRDGFLSNAMFMRIPAVGIGGRQFEGLLSIGTFLGLNPTRP